MHNAKSLVALFCAVLLLAVIAPTAAQKTLWSFDNGTSVTIVSVVRAAGPKNVVVVGAAPLAQNFGANTVAGYDAANGTQLWSRTIGTASYGVLQFVVRHGGEDSAVVLAFFSGGAVMAIDAVRPTAQLQATRQMVGGALGVPTGPWRATPVSNGAASSAAALTYAVSASNDVFVISIASRMLSVKLYAAASEHFWRNASGHARLALVPGSGDVLVSVDGTGVGRLRAGVALWTNTREHAVGISYGVAVTAANPEVGSFASVNGTSYLSTANGLNLTSGVELWSHVVGRGGAFEDIPEIDFQPTISPDGRLALYPVFYDSDNWIETYVQTYHLVNGTELWPGQENHLSYTSPITYVGKSIVVGAYQQVNVYGTALNFQNPTTSFTAPVASCQYVEAAPVYFADLGSIVGYCGGGVFAFQGSF